MIDIFVLEIAAGFGGASGRFWWRCSCSCCTCAAGAGGAASVGADVVLVAVAAAHTKRRLTGLPEAE